MKRALIVALVLAALAWGIWLMNTGPQQTCGSSSCIVGRDFYPAS